MNKGLSCGFTIIVLLVLLYLAFRKRAADSNLEYASKITTLANYRDPYN